MKIIVYPVQEVRKEGKSLLVKAGKKWTDDKRIIQYEGFILRLENFNELEETEFVVSTLKKGENIDEFVLGLHTHAGECCEHDSGMVVSEKLLKQWTGLSSADLEVGTKMIHIGATFNILANLPRLVTIRKEAVEVEFGHQKKIDALNSCNLVFNREYPLDHN